ncbi:MAG: hypothetical protein ABI692_14335 [Terracoccus sp.]
MGEVEDGLKTYYAGEMADRAGRGLGEHRTGRVRAFRDRQTGAACAGQDCCSSVTGGVLSPAEAERLGSSPT